MFLFPIAASVPFRNEPIMSDGNFYAMTIRDMMEKRAREDKPFWSDANKLLESARNYVQSDGVALTMPGGNSRRHVNVLVEELEVFKNDEKNDLLLCSEEANKKMARLQEMLEMLDDSLSVKVVLLQDGPTVAYAVRVSW